MYTFLVNPYTLRKPIFYKMERKTKPSLSWIRCKRHYSYLVNSRPGQRMYCLTVSRDASLIEQAKDPSDQKIRR